MIKIDSQIPQIIVTIDNFDEQYEQNNSAESEDEEIKEITSRCNQLYAQSHLRFEVSL
jgi:hypothetical protein